MTHRITSLHCRVGVALLAMIAGGCGSSSNTVPVHGHVEFRGEAVAKGAVTFFPDKGRPITVPLSEQGDYGGDLPPGEYTVVVNVGFDRPEGFKEFDPMPPPKFVLPDEYTTRAKSTLTASVAADQADPINFELK